MREFYDSLLLSLGSNCEVSFQIRKYVDKFYSSLFSWAGVDDEFKFLKALDNIDDIFEHDITFHMPSDDMFMDNTYKIAFHGRTKKNMFMDSCGNIINVSVYEESLAETKSRVRHLKEKFKRDLRSDERKVFIKAFPYAYDCDTVYVCGQGVMNFLFKNAKNYELVLVCDKKKFSTVCNAFEGKNNVHVACVDFFAPVGHAADGADDVSWKRILGGCAGKHIFEK